MSLESIYIFGALDFRNFLTLFLYYQPKHTDTQID